MVNVDNIISKDGYLVYENTGEKVVWYECDPNKNKECDKTMCRTDDVEGHSFGFCSKTINPEYRKIDGTKWYAVLKSDEDNEPYWGREYIQGGDVV